MMKISSVVGVGLMAAAVSFNTGCDWSSGGGTDSFNTSQGAGINANVSGVYNGNLSGGRAVSPTTAGNITKLVISQTGNSVEIVDNQGSKYSGTVGSPGLVSEPDATGKYPAGAEIMQSQITFSGKDGVSAKSIEFVGIIHVVAISDIQGTSTTDTKTESSGSGSTNATSETQNTGTERTTTSSVDDGTNTTVTTTLEIGVPADPFYQKTVTVVVVNNESGQEISRNVTTTGSTSSGNSDSEGTSRDVTTTTTTTYEITQPASQWQLEGTWIEDGGVVGTVDAISPGGSGFVTTVTTETAQ